MKPRTLVLLIALAALLAKVYCAATTLGTKDVDFFYKFAELIQKNGLIALYQMTPFFNHTPIVGWYSVAAWRLAEGDREIFGFYLRLAPIFADFIAVLALLWLREKTGRPAWWVIGLFAASPVSFMVSGFHGNVDSILAAGVLCAGVACALNRPALCGLFLGLSCNIKIIPVLLAPVFFFLWWERRQALRFTLPVVLTVLAGWAVPLISIPLVFLKNVLGYSSVWGVWGFTYPLRLSGIKSLSTFAFMTPTPEQSAIMLAAKVLIVGAVLTLAWRRRRAELPEVFLTLAVAWAIFFVFTPGFGPHYLVWLAPCFAVATARWFAALSVTSSISTFVYYNMLAGKIPWNEGTRGYQLAPQWAPWMVLPWLVIAAFLGAVLWETFRAGRAKKSPAAESRPPGEFLERLPGEAAA